MIRKLLISSLLLSLTAGLLHAYEGGRTGGRLYTDPDPSASGGITGQVGFTQSPLRAAFAMPPTDVRLVYRGTIEGTNRFNFRGLPVGRYDLVLVFDDGFYEGISLARENTLTDRDVKLIKEHLSATVPFFPIKTYHRYAGTTGRGQEARVVYQEMRDNIRTIKLGIMQDVGDVGWQLVRSREIIRIDSNQTTSRPGVIPHHHRPDLGGIRVVDSVRDLETIR